MFLEESSVIKERVALWKNDWVFLAGLDNSDHSSIKKSDYELAYLDIVAGCIYRVSYLQGVLGAYPLDNISRMDTFYRYFQDTTNEANLITIRKILAPYLLLYNL